MDRFALVAGAVVLVGCVVPKADRSYYVNRGAYDLQCPEEEYVAEPPVPLGWRAKGVDSAGSSDASVGEIVYETPSGSTTWCRYSSQVWAKQASELRAHQEPTMVFDNPARRRLIERAREQQLDVERTAAAARAAEERSKRDEEHARAESERSERESRENAIRTTAAAITVQNGLRAFVSMRRCMIQRQIDFARDELKRERRVGRESGYEDKRLMHELGDDLVSLQDQMDELNATIREGKIGSPMPCRGTIDEVVDCHEDKQKCASRELAVAARGFDLAMIAVIGGNDQQSVDSLTEAARSTLDESSTREANELGLAVSAMLSR